MRFIWLTGVKDWLRHRRDPVGLLIWIGVPILIGGLMTVISGGKSGVQPHARVLIADQDNSSVSAMLETATSQLGGLIETEAVALESGRERVNNGEASALLVIPAGFGQAVINEDPTTLTLYTNPAEIILPGIVKETVSIVVDATFYAHRVLGDEAPRIFSGPGSDSGTPDSESGAALAQAIGAVMQRISRYTTPPAITITTPPVLKGVEEANESQPISLALLFLPSTLFMSLLFMAQGLSMDLWQERDQHTLRRVVASPQSSHAFLAGKLLGSAGIVFVVSTVAMLVGYSYFRLNFALLPLAIVWCVLSGVMLSNLLTIIQLFASTQKAGGVISMALIFPLMMIGGNFFPFEAMPAWMSSIGTLTPNGWAMVQLKDILFDRVDVPSFVRACAGIVGVSAVLFVLNARRMRTHFAQG